MVFEIILELKRRRRKLAATSRRSNVLTSQRRDVWSIEEKVNERPNITTSQRHDVSTSRRLNVTTSQRHDVSTSRRLNVTTSQRHDFCLKIIKSNGVLIGRREGRVDWSTENRAATTRIIGKDSAFVFFFSHKRLMICRMMCIFSSNMF